MDSGDTPVPLELAQQAAAGDPILRSMIERGLPLTRNKYISQSYLDLPDEWTAEHEMGLPEVFQDPDEVGRTD